MNRTILRAVRTVFRLLLRAAILQGLTCGLAKADDGYQLGHGYDIGPFNLAGYSNVTAALPDEGRDELVLDDLSLFVTGHVSSYFNPFVEAELTRLDIIHGGAGGRDRGDGALVLERLYNDSELADGLTLRLGKMLSPVGEWNQIHAAPLVLSTVRPAATYRNFSEYLTGVSLLYRDPDDSIPGVQLYWQPDREFSERPRTITFNEYRAVEGIHVSFPVGLLDQVGFSFQKSRDTQGIGQSLFGTDFQYTIRKLTLQGEWTYSDLSGRAPGQVRQFEWGGYLAASYAFADSWSAYSWYEEFSNRTAASDARDLLVGVAYRPHPAIVIKLEYLQNIGGPPVNPTGLFASWSVLF